MVASYWSIISCVSAAFLLFATALFAEAKSLLAFASSLFNRSLSFFASLRAVSARFARSSAAYLSLFTAIKDSCKRRKSSSEIDILQQPTTATVDNNRKKQKEQRSSFSFCA
eukprot:m.325114 g.325114  ORF g.325114 m.325114 type:complete len:112 (+) comp55552_c0_seq1:651-986(+)